MALCCCPRTIKVAAAKTRGFWLAEPPSSPPAVSASPPQLNPVPAELVWLEQVQVLGDLKLLLCLTHGFCVCVCVSLSDDIHARHTAFRSFPR